jgi:hypothetical protein
MSDLFTRRDVYRRFSEIAKASPAYPIAIDFIEWAARNFVDASCIALRRFNDRDGRSVSLRQLLEALRDTPSLLTRSVFQRLRRRPSVSRGEINATFDKLVGRRATGISASWCLKRLRRLDRADALIRRYVNKFVAHKGRLGSIRRIPKLADFDAAIAEVDGVLVDLRLALTGERHLTMKAATLHPWQRAFSQAWVATRRAPATDVHSGS